MAKIAKRLSLAIFLIAFVFGFVACKNKVEPTPQPTPKPTVEPKVIKILPNAFSKHSDLFELGDNFNHSGLFMDLIGLDDKGQEFVIRTEAVDLSKAEWELDSSNFNANQKTKGKGVLESPYNIVVYYTKADTRLSYEYSVHVIDVAAIDYIRVKMLPKLTYEHNSGEWDADTSSYKNRALDLTNLKIAVATDTGDIVDKDYKEYSEGDKEKWAFEYYDEAETTYKPLEALDFDVTNCNNTLKLKVAYSRLKNGSDPSNPESWNTSYATPGEAVLDSENVAVTDGEGNPLTHEDFTLSVYPYIAEMEITEPTLKEYIVSESLDKQGLSVKLKYSDGSYVKADDGTTDLSYDFSTDSNLWEMRNAALASAKIGHEISLVYKGEGLRREEFGKNPSYELIGTFPVDVYRIKSLTPEAVPSEEYYRLIYFVDESVKDFEDIFLSDAQITMELEAPKANGEMQVKSEEILIKDIDNYNLVATSTTDNLYSDNKTFKINDGQDVGAVGITLNIRKGEITGSATYALIIKPVYKFHTTITKYTGANPVATSVFDNVLADGTTCKVTSEELVFVEFGDYPQTVSNVAGAGTHIYEVKNREKTVGGLTMYLGEDGSYHVKEKARRFEKGIGQYEFSVQIEGQTITHELFNEQDCWFRVEPIVWRVLDTNYKGNGETESAGALLYAVKSLDRIPFFADSNSPKSGHQIDSLTGGGKSTRSINGEYIHWTDYKYSTVRAFLRGEYEENDMQASETQLYTIDNSELPKFTGKGFLQNAFDKDISSMLVPVPIDYKAYNGTFEDEGTGSIITKTVTDAIFLLSEDEITKSDASYYFAKGDKVQNQRKKQITDYTMAREGKKWNTTTPEGEKVENPGSEFWLRDAAKGTETVNGITYTRPHIKNIGGNGKLNTIARGAYRAMSVVPAICVNVGELP